MPLFSDKVSLAVFKRSISDNGSNVTLSGLMLKVLMELDGKRNLSDIQRALKTDLSELEDIVRALENLQLIERVNMPAPALDTDFFDFLAHQLHRALGPIAEVIIEEELQKFSDGPQEMALQNAAELVDLLARQIPRTEKRIQFQQTMVHKIRELSS